MMRTTVGAAVSVLLACSSGLDSTSTSAWDPDDPDAGGSGGSDAADGGQADDAPPADDGGDPTGGADGAVGECEPGASAPCLCPDGLHLGEQSCSADGVFGACLPCEDAGTGGETEDTGAGSSDGGPALPTEVCYPGEDSSYTTCLPLHYFEPDAMPAGYAYPGVLEGNQNYRDPIAFLDLEENDPATKLAPNFILGEIADPADGRWGIVQPSAMESLQALRDEVGGIVVNSGFRSPGHNTAIDGATWSRHIYGDGFDLDPVDVGLGTLETACTSSGGFLVEYTTHVHCDFRDAGVSEEFFGPVPMGAPIELQPVLSAALESQDGVWSAPAVGFSEGTPRRRWQALDDDGAVVATGSGPTFSPPREATSIAVQVGRAIELWQPL